MVTAPTHGVAAAPTCQPRVTGGQAHQAHSEALVIGTDNKRRRLPDKTTKYQETESEISNGRVPSCAQGRLPTGSPMFVQCF